MIIAVSGTPGAGKTGAAVVLAKELGFRLVNLHELAKKKGCISGFDKGRKCDIVDTKKLAGEVRKMEGDVIVEAHFAHEMPSDVLFILTAHPGVLRGRLRAKGWPDRKVEENVTAEIMEVCMNEAMESGKKFIRIDTTKKTPEQTARKMIKALEDKK